MRRIVAIVSIAAALSVLASTAVSAQSTTTEVRTGEILWVQGNTVVVRGPEGVKEFLVSDDARFNMDGKQLSVHELKPGMKFAAVIQTVTVPITEYAEEVKQAEVVHVLGSTVVVKLDDGTYKKFTADDMKDIKVTFTRDGKETTAAGLHKGDKISATVITKMPPKELSASELTVYLKNPPPPPPPPVAAASAPAVASPEPPPAAPKKLPKTGSPVASLFAAGLAALLAGGAMTVRRILARA